MGTTASVIRIKNNELCISQIGDITIYVLSYNKITKYTDK